MAKVTQMRVFLKGTQRHWDLESSSPGDVSVYPPWARFIWAGPAVVWVSKRQILAGLLPTPLLLHFLCPPGIPSMKAFIQLGPTPLPPRLLAS